MTPRTLAPADALRLRRGVEHLHRLGPRVVAEYLAECAAERADLATMLDRLDLWRARLSPELIRAAGGEGFPPSIAGARTCPADRSRRTGRAHPGGEGGT